MDTEENNTIKLDFGAGNVTPLPSRCLRVAKEPTDCDICAQICPVSALTLKPLTQDEEEADNSSAEGAAQTKDSSEDKNSLQSRAIKPVSNAQSSLEKKLGIKVNEDCIHCGICAAACPLEAISTTKHHIKGFEKQVKEKTALAEGLAFGCVRSLYGAPPRVTRKAVSFPCLAVLSPEEWFYAAASARDAILVKEIDEDIIGYLKVFLPPLSCSDCPVNVCGDAEAAYLAAISQAESWGAYNIELVDDPEELRNSSSGLLASTLGDAASNDKREFAEQLAAGLKRSWQSAGEDLTRERSRAELLAESRKKAKKKAPANLNAPRPFGKKSQRRRLLRDALERDAVLTTDVELVSTGTETAICVGCGHCVYACPLNARRRVSSNSVLYFGKLPEEQRPKDKQAAVTDYLCCLGCSACAQACPIGACTLSWLSGEEFVNLRLN